MAAFAAKVYRAEETYTLEGSSWQQMRCPNDNPTRNPIQAIRIGKFNTFWQKSVTVSQVAKRPNYDPLSINFYLIPEQKLQVHTDTYTCSCNEYCHDTIKLSRFYLLEGSSVHFTMLVNSTDPIDPGFVNLTICDNYTDFQSSLASCSWHHVVTVQPNEGDKPLITTFTAPKDSYYFITTYDTLTSNARISSYEIVIEIKFLNASDWGEIRPAVKASEDDLPDTTYTIYEGHLSENMLRSKEYVIVAQFPTGQLSERGQMKINEHHRSTVYIVPAIVAGGPMVLGVTAIACVCAWNEIFKRKRNRSESESDTKRLIRPV
jgi:hypothetical protein